TRAQAAVCGHTHRPERVDLPGAHALFVLGAWEENPSVYLEFADGEFRWRAWA
ncbi:MAG: hypothetical protein HZA54_15180, partial [Planctomycetes bacterium]|nr:hypothetical protein [Planctomycetota bacterium]